MFQIVIEGADAVGKNTQSESVANALKLWGWGKEVAVYHFPQYKTQIGEVIGRLLQEPYSMDRAIQLQALMLMDKAAAVHYMRIQEVLGGMFVVTDRWWQSALVYGQADGLDGEMLNSISTSLYSPTALNILLTLDRSKADARRPIPLDRYEKDKDKMRRVKELYDQLWAHAPSKTGVWRVVDADAPVEEVTKQIMVHVLEHLDRLHNHNASHV